MKATPEVLAKRKIWAADGVKAWDEYLAGPAVVAAKTARLKQARQERDEAEKVELKKNAVRIALQSARKARTVSPRRRLTAQAVRKTS